MNKIKTIFKPEELEDAVIQLYKLRLVHGWAGCLSLWHVPRDDEIVIMRFPSSSTYIEDATLLYEIESWYSWSDFLLDSGVHEEKNQVLLSVEEWATDWHDDLVNHGVKIHDGHYIIEQKDKSWFFDILDTNGILEDEQRLALEELENSQAKKEIKA